MASQTIVVTDIPEELVQRLDARVREHGGDRAGFIRELLQRVLDGEPAPQAEPSLDALLAPIRQGFEASGLTDDELDKLFEEAREEVWRAKHSGGAE